MLGREFKALREQCGLSRDALTQALGVNKFFVRNLEYRYYHSELPESALAAQEYLQKIEAGATAAAAEVLLGKDLRKRREQLGISRAVLAEVLGVYEETLKKWETEDKAKPISKRWLKALDKYFTRVENAIKKQQAKQQAVPVTEQVQQPEPKPEPAPVTEQMDAYDRLDFQSYEDFRRALAIKFWGLEGVELPAHFTNIVVSDFRIIEQYRALKHKLSHHEQEATRAREELEVFKQQILDSV